MLRVLLVFLGRAVARAGGICVRRLIILRHWWRVWLLGLWWGAFWYTSFEGDAEDEACTRRTVGDTRAHRAKTVSPVGPIILIGVILERKNTQSSISNGWAHFLAEHLRAKLRPSLQVAVCSPGHDGSDTGALRDI